MFKKLLATLALVALLATPAFAATTANSSITPQTPNRGIVQFLQGTDVAGTYKTLITANANGTIVKGMFITTNDATAHLITCQIVNGGVKYGGFSLSTGTATPGFATAVPSLSPMTSANWGGLANDSDGNPYFFMVSGDTLQCTYATALTASDVINIVAIDADF